MQHGRLIVLVILAAIFALPEREAEAADIDIPWRPAPAALWVQQAPAHCSRWTDQCVNCSRGADGEPPLCSNIGFACQPQAIRCLSSAVPQGDPAKK